jgi:hypothetical protein
MEERLSGIIDNIRNWLKEEDILYRIKENSTNELTLWYSKDRKLEARVNNDKLTISYTHIFHQDIKKFLTEYYFNELDLLLHQQIPNFIFLYNKQNPSELVGIKFIRDIWSDSLTKTSFFDTIVAVQHSIYIVKIKEREWQMIKT